MKIIEAITNALDDYENKLNYQINILENKIKEYEKERELFIRYLEEGKIELLKNYFLRQ